MGELSKKNEVYKLIKKMSVEERVVIENGSLKENGSCRKRKNEDSSDMRDLRLPKNKRVISPAIMKMSRMFENGEKDDKPEDEIREKQESKVSKIRNSLEEMMSNTKVRKKKYEVREYKLKGYSS